MKKILGLLAVFGLVASISASGVATADHFTFPSDNETNKANNWAHVEEVSVDVGEVTLSFTNSRNFASCFEYRTYGDESQKISDTNFNPNAHDLYPYFCINNETVVETFQADEYVEIRMVFGAESDERFDWTRFDVMPTPPFERSAEITSPTSEQVITTGNLSLKATLIDEDGDDTVQWAVRSGTCTVGTGTVAGNVDGFNTPYTWTNGMTFESSLDVSSWENGNYCFVFNPSESEGDAQIRETVEFSIFNEDEEEPQPTTPTSKDECKNGGWMTFTSPTFNNQGQCVSLVASGGRSMR